MSVPFTISGIFNDGNVFTAYLSDETGSFATETAIGTYTSITAGTITAEIPAGTTSGTAYRIRVKSDNPIVTGSDNGLDFEIINISNDITPANNQYVFTSENGTELTVNESMIADNREWKFSTISGSDYISFTTSETSETYTPTFDTQGIYYIICESTFSGGDIITISNEIKIIVDTNNSDYYLAFDGDDSFYIEDANQDFINISDNWTIETWVKVNDYTDATFPVIIDRDRCFSMYVQGDDTDDFSIAFVTRDADDGIVSSLSSANNDAVDFILGEWYHIAAQYDGTTAKLFINGNEIDSKTDDFTLLAATADFINVGARYRTTFERFLTGSVENVHISDVARYTTDFTPDFYAQQQADENSIFCFNLENNEGTELFDASGNFTNIVLRNSPNDAEWKLKIQNALTPVDIQTINEGENGDILTVLENGLATSREWKYSTTSGSGYIAFGTSEVTKNYTPNFATLGTYYIVCETVFNGTTFTSNEVQINVIEEVELTITTSAISGSPFVVTDLAGASIDISFIITGIFDDTNTFTAYLSDEVGDFSSEIEIGTLSSATAGTINAEIPENTASGTEYRVRVKSDNPEIIGTDNGTDFEIILDDGDNISDINNSDITVYPNPVSDILFINANLENAEIQIFDNLGKIVISEKLDNNSIDVSILKSGSYIIKIQNNSIIKFNHFIKY